MRYYKIIITDPVTNKVIKTWTSLASDGSAIPGALNIELDFPVYNLDASNGAAYLKVWGISIQDIGQSFDLNFKNIQVFAGMSKGLPLANPAQAGLILQGTIQQAFGNWQDINQSLDFMISAQTGSPDAPVNIVSTWNANTLLATSIKNTLLVAFPNYTANINISPNLVLNQDEPGYYQSLGQFAQYIKNVSQHIIGVDGYNGVSITIKENQFNVYDGTTKTTPKAIGFTDLIGQPTWGQSGVINFKCVMRSDINVGDYISMPKGIMVTTTAQSYSQYKNKTAFDGSFQVSQVRHVGNFRQQDANSWVTVFDAYVP